MTKVGFHQYPPMDQVIFGKPAGQALREEAGKRDAKRVFLIVSRTLNTKTDEIEKIRNALGSRYAGTFDGVPQHTTRASAVEATAHAAEAKADLVTQEIRNMKKLLEVYITKGIPMLDLNQLEKFSEEWLEAGAHVVRDTLLPHFINQKLLRYEQEY